MSGYRLPSTEGEWIDRRHAVTFQVDGRPVCGYQGDTVASALLAAGVMQVGRSFKLHRPRGIVAWGVEEPNALLDLVEGQTRTPHQRATDLELRERLRLETVNRWPTLDFDLAAVNARFAGLMPAGF